MVIVEALENQHQCCCCVEHGSVVLSRQRGRFEKTAGDVKSIPENPGDEEEDRDPMAGFGAEIGDDLRDFSDSPGEDADEPQPEREAV